MSETLAERYELGELVDRGAMADVYRAHDRLLDRTVAVKLFRATSDPDEHRRFDDEAHALARLIHPGLVLIFDVGALGDRPFLVMEFVEGTSLQSLLLDGPLPARQVMRIGAVLAEALAHAHSRGVVHRDVKPSNVLLDSEGLPHVTDFGIALLAGTPPAYLAPEQLAERETGPPADVYALALVLLECLTGEIEYDADNRPPRIPPGLPAEFAELLAAMTSVDATERPTAARCALRLLPGLDDTEAVPTDRSEVAPQAAGEEILWWADEDRTELVPAAPTPAMATPATAALAPVRSGTASRRRRALTASMCGVAAVIVALVFLLGTHQPSTPRSPGGAAGSVQGSVVPGNGTNHGGSAGVGGGGAHRAPRTGTLVANENSIAVTLSATPSAADPPTSSASLPASSPAPSDTTSPDSPTPTSSDSPTTTSESPPPPTTNGQ